MKNLTAKTLKILIAFLVATLSFFIIHNRPWNPMIEIDFKDLLDQKIEITVQRVDGTKRTHFFSPEKNKSIFRSATSKILFIKQNYADKEISYISQDSGQKKFNLKKGITPFPLQESSRNNSYVLESCLIFSILIFLLIWICLESIKPLLEPKKTLPLLAFHTLFFGLLYYITYPGLFNYDSFENMMNGGRYYHSAFIGDIFFALVAIPLQFSTTPWFIGLINTLTIIVSLTIISNISIRLGTLKYYLIGLALFLLNSANWLISMNITRDTMCFWIFVTTLFVFYDRYIRQVKSFSSLLLIATGTIISCLLRQESALIMLPSMIIISLFIYKDFFKPSLTILILFLVSSRCLTIVDVNEMDYNNYKTTLLVSPLSHILKTKYPKEIPAEIDQRLGTYFKNDYLIKHYSETDIKPFHMGGVDFSKAGIEDFNKFKKGAIELMIENPTLYVENRIITTRYLLGLEPDWYYVSEDLYYLNRRHRSVYFSQIMKELSIDESLSVPWKRAFINKVDEFTYYNHLLAASYIIPLALMFILLFLRPISLFFISLSSVMLARTLLVCLIAPAGYFKYLYPLWIFAPFVFCILMGERRLRLTKVQ